MTEITPNRGPVPPASGGGNLRASEADRDAVAAVPNTAFAEGRITTDEHPERLEAVMSAKTFDDLIPITADLVPTSPPRLAAVPDQQTSYAIDTRNAQAEPDRFIAIFGGATRSGRWRVRKQSQAYALFGGID